jgi:hypothetical protein
MTKTLCGKCGQDTLIHLVDEGGYLYCVEIECPNHEGAYDCTPFCRLCEGNQGYVPEIKMEVTQ